MGISKNNVRIQVTLSKEIVDFLDAQADIEFRDRSEMAGFAIIKYLRECGYSINVDSKSKK